MGPESFIKHWDETSHLGASWTTWDRDGSSEEPGFGARWGVQMAGETRQVRAELPAQKSSYFH